MLQALKKSHTDDLLESVGLHAYGQPRLSYNLITGLQAKTALPFWLTETGLHIGQPSPWPIGECDSQQPCGNEEQQAAYVVQQYVWALKAFHDTGRPGKVFHFAFKDTDLPWGLLDSGAPREAYQAFQFIVRTLHGATYEGYEQQEGYIRMSFTSATKHISVLWATTGNTYYGAGFVSAWIKATARQAYLYDQTGRQVNTYGHPSDKPIEAVGGYYSIQLPIATHPKVVVNDERMIGGRTFILIEPLGGSTPPSLHLSLVCRNGRPAGVDYWAYDGGAGYKSLSAIASPLRTYDLAPWTEPDRVYYGTIWEVPPVGATATITLTNQAGLSAVRTLHNPGPAYCAINPPDPGNDHLDDNYSAADAPIPPGQFLAAPAGARMPPRAAILNRGAAHGLWWLLMQLGEPVEWVDVDFAPVATARQYPVLLIPSGGLPGATPPSQG